MNKILSFIDAKCPQNIYKSIISDIEKIERQFEIMQTNKFKNLKLKEQFRLLLNMLQSPNTSVNIEKTTLLVPHFFWFPKKLCKSNEKSTFLVLEVPHVFKRPWKTNELVKLCGPQHV